MTFVLYFIFIFILFIKIENNKCKGKVNQLKSGVSTSRYLQYRTYIGIQIYLTM